MMQFTRGAYIDMIRYMTGKRQRKKQEDDSDGKYRGKGVIIDPLLIVLVLIQISEKSGLHAERKHRIQYGHIAEHSGQDAISTELVGDCVNRGEKKG
jgi:hypothetical protein